VSVVEGSWRELVEPLRDGAIDLMIGALRDPPAPPDLVQAPLFQDRLIVVSGPGHPLARHPNPTMAMLGCYPWIVGPEGSPLRLLWEQLFAQQERPAHPIACGSVMAIRGILRETTCLTLLSPEQVLMEVRAGILAQVGAPLSRMVRTIGITRRAGWRPTSAQSLLLRLLHDAGETQNSSSDTAPHHTISENQ
jgi:LysR family transcriptional regulator of gallate degradation